MSLTRFHQPARWAALAAMAAGMFLAGCKPKPQDDAKKATEPPRITIGPENYAVVGQGVLQTGPAISGKLTPKLSATMRAQVAGAVLHTYADQGGRVGSGMLLAQLDDRAIRDAVVSAQSGVTNAQSALQVAERDQGRQETLAKAGAVAERDVDNARRNTVAARAALAQAQAQLVSAQKQLAFTQIRAPFAGIVSEKLASTGDIVQPGTALFTVVNPSSMELEASVPAEQLSQIHIGAPVQFTVTGYPDRAFNGTITRINPSADPATRQVRVYAEIPNSGSTLVGELYAEGRIASQSRSALIVPASTIDHRMSKPAVMRIRDGKVERVDVTLGITDEQTDRIEITNGVRMGDTLLAGAAQQVNPGTLVRVSASPAASISDSTGRNR